MKFLVDWLDNLRQYEAMTHRSYHFSDQMKKALLQNAVSNLKHFRDVKLAESIGIAQSHGTIPYPNYIILLQGAATLYDESNSTRQDNMQNLINQTSPCSKEMKMKLHTMTMIDMDRNNRKNS